MHIMAVDVILVDLFPYWFNLRCHTEIEMSYPGQCKRILTAGEILNLWHEANMEKVLDEYDSKPAREAECFTDYSLIAY